MGLYRWLGELLRPCVHTWRIASKMEDDPDNPNTVVIVRECEICGELDEQKFIGPKKVEKCPPHRWNTTHRAAVWGESGDKFPSYHRLEQQCTKCGDVRAVDLRPQSEGKKK